MKFIFYLYIILILSGCGFQVEDQGSLVSSQGQVANDQRTIFIEGSARTRGKTTYDLEYEWTFIFTNGRGEKIGPCVSDFTAAKSPIENYVNNAPGCSDFNPNGVGYKVKLEVVDTQPAPIYIEYCLRVRVPETGFIEIKKSCSNLGLKDQKLIPEIVFTGASDKTIPLQYTINFYSNVTGVELTDFIVDNGSLSNLAGGPSQYTFDVTPIHDGVFEMSYAAARAVSADGKDNIASSKIVSDRFSLISAGRVAAVRFDYPGFQKCVMVQNNSTQTSIVYNDNAAKYESFISTPPVANNTSIVTQTPLGSLIATDDAVVIRYSANPIPQTNNYGEGSYTSFELWTVSSQPVYSKALIKFDLSNYTFPVTNATLRLSNPYNTAYAPFDTYNTTRHGKSSSLASTAKPWSVYRATSPWQESLVTWDTQPSKDVATAIAGPLPSTKTDDAIIDITALVNDALASGSNHGVLLEHNVGESYYSYHGFTSKESKVSCAYPPLLDITQ